MSSYAGLRAILAPYERRVLSELSEPRSIQDHLDSLPVNFESEGDTCMSPRLVMRRKVAHCFEGAILAATALAYHGKPPLLMDLRAGADDDDHVVALFRQNGYWGAISKTNHPVLRYRDPVYSTTRELAMSYFHEYIGESSRSKVLKAYSAPFDLRKYPPEKWVVADESLKWLSDELDNSRHFPTVPKKNRRLLRDVSEYEWKASDITEWKRPQKFRGRKP
ncbi:MAG: hypothetical protein NUV59_02550 [Patescibacteria group bacterium]|nr:hypothetical protein [Patescibacteria group bacterium]